MVPGTKVAEGELSQKHQTRARKRKEPKENLTAVRETTDVQLGANTSDNRRMGSS
jgi:hypothetical protein